MDWSTPTLKHFYETTIGNTWPYKGGSEEDLNTYFRGVVDDLQNSGLISVWANFDDGGFASYLELFCYKKDGSSRQTLSGCREEIMGILVYISHHAPIAAYGAGRRTQSRRPEIFALGFNRLGYDDIDTVPPGDWQEILDEICTKLKQAGLEVANSEALNERLPPEVSLELEQQMTETMLGEPPYRIFDLLFEWCD